MDRDSLIRHVTEVVRERVPSFNRAWCEDTPLGPEGAGLDSVAYLEVILELEARTGITIREESLTAESLHTIRSLADYLVVSGRRANA